MPRISPRGTLRALLVVIGLLLALHLVSVALVARAGGPHGVAWWAMTYLGVDSEQSLSTVYSIAALAALAFLCVRVGLLHLGRSRLTWWALAAVVAVMTWDESAQLHEKAGWMIEHAGLNGPFAYGWLVLGIPAVVVVGALSLAVLRDTPRDVLRGLVLAGLVFVAGAVGVEIVAGLFVDAGIGGEDPRMLALTTVEEGLEMIGVALALTTLLGYHERLLGERPAGRERARVDVPGSVAGVGSARVTSPGVRGTRAAA